MKYIELLKPLEEHPSLEETVIGGSPSPIVVGDWSKAGKLTAGIIVGGTTAGAVAGALLCKSDRPFGAAVGAGLAFVALPFLSVGYYLMTRD